MSTNRRREARVARTPDFALTLDEIRAVSSFTAACGELVLDLFEEVQPDDPRPRKALEAARAFAEGGPRTVSSRACATAAHRAAKTVGSAAAHAAMSAGDAAASAYLHPLADATQVGHILRGPAHAVLAQQWRPAWPSPDEARAAVVRLATPEMLDVLRRYPSATVGARGVAAVVGELDMVLRPAGS